jgi:cytochrome c-type biogenesis protein CcsB
VIDEQLAQASNVLIYSAMIVYTGALAAFAIDLSGRGRVAADGGPAREATHEPAAERELVAAGGTAAPGTREPGAPASGAVPGGPAGDPGGSDDDASDVPLRRRAAGIAVSLTWLAFALHLGGVVARGLSAHRPPWGNMYEFTISGAVVITGVFLLTLLRRDLRYLGTFVVGPVLLSLGLAISVLYTQAAQLLPALQSVWLVIHVTVAFTASALFTIAFSATVLQLVQDRRERATAAGRPPVRGRWMGRIPGSVELERTAYRLNAVAFPLWTFTVMAGAIWAERSWGRYWNWDPKEVWSFVIWVVYAGYLHARATRGWDGRRAAYLGIAGFACILFNFLVVNIFFPGLHAYSGVG